MTSSTETNGPGPTRARAEQLAALVAERYAPGAATGAGEDRIVRHAISWPRPTRVAAGWALALPVHRTARGAA